MDGQAAALLKRCRRIGTSTWSDALDEFGIDGVVRGLTQRSGNGRFVGFAVTVREIGGPLGSYTTSDFGMIPMITQLGEGEVLMVDMGSADISTFGGLAALATKMRGGVAVVIDGACRDLEEIRSHDLWLASRSVTPITGKKRLKLVSMMEPVTIGGIKVSAGDIVVGDQTGIVVIPRVDLQRVLVWAEAMLVMDHQIETALKKGESFGDAAAAANYL